VGVSVPVLGPAVSAFVHSPRISSGSVILAGPTMVGVSEVYRSSGAENAHWDYPPTVVLD
jgi:hypothetical protein